MSRKLDLLTPEEHVVLAHWLGVQPVVTTEPRIPIETALSRLQCLEEGSYGAAAHAVASIVLNSIQEQLPCWTACVREEDGSLKIVEARVILARRRRKLALFPRHLFTINWASSAPGYDWPSAYYVTWVPLYDVHVVTTSADCADAEGYEDAAIGHFGPSSEVARAAGEVIVADWRQRRDLGQEKWENAWAAGLLSFDDLEALADQVWQPDDEAVEGLCLGDD